jgi:Stealth protein CR2, conserved region 2/Stealth protein CR1, conserved region 1/Stealth protein CR3, conserved region 3
MSKPSSDLPIDAVITWVDGSDPAHKAKLNAQLRRQTDQRPAGANPARFHDSGEISLCVLSLLAFAPWLRKIFIVTDEQTPEICSLLSKTAYADKVRVVDHREIFIGFEEYLPTFNSLSISTMLWRVPGLAENFLYLNDDFVLIQPTLPEYFFQREKVVIRGCWKTFSANQVGREVFALITHLFKHESSTAEKHASYRKGMESGAKILGFADKYLDLPHNPHSWKKSLLQEFYQTFPELLRQNASFKFRSHEQLYPESLMAHLAIKQRKAIVDNHFKVLQLKPGEQTAGRIKAKLAAAEADANFVFACVQSLEDASAKCRSMIWKWLDERIGSQELLKVVSAGDINLDARPTLSLYKPDRADDVIKGAFSEPAKRAA